MTQTPDKLSINFSTDRRTYTGGVGWFHKILAIFTLAVLAGFVLGLGSVLLWLVNSLD